MGDQGDTRGRPVDLSKIPLETMRTLPAGKPPMGEVTNFIDPFTTAPILAAVTTTFFVLATLFYLNRMYTKLHIIRKLSWDDFTITLGWLCTLLLYGGVLKSASGSVVGRHQWNVRLSDLNTDAFAISTYLAIIPLPVALLFIKLTFFLMYQQLFFPLRWMRLANWIGSVLTIAFYGATTVVFAYYVIQRPGETFLVHVTGPLERKANLFAIPVYGVGIAFDLAILILPISAVLQLQLSRRKKVGVSLIFMSGILACVTSAINVYYRVVNVRSLDSTFTLVPIEVMTLVEMYIGIMCACMPSLAKMLHHHFPSWNLLRSKLSSLTGLNRSGNKMSGSSKGGYGSSKDGWGSKSISSNSNKKGSRTTNKSVGGDKEWDEELYGKHSLGLNGAGKGFASAGAGGVTNNTNDLERQDTESISLPSLDMRQPQKVHTFIETGKNESMSHSNSNSRDDQIYVGYEIEQKRQRGAS